MSKHTPGPWEAITYSNGSFDIESPHGSDHAGLLVIASRSQHGHMPDVMRANARLIAAAPDLLEALQMIYGETADYIRLNNLGGMDNQCMKLSRAAIAKATGEGA